MQGIFMFAVAPPKGVSNHTVEIDGDGNGAKPALDRVRTRSLKSRRLHRPNAIAESANSHRSVLVWPTDAPNKGAQRAPTGVPTSLRFWTPDPPATSGANCRVLRRAGGGTRDLVMRWYAGGWPFTITMYAIAPIVDLTVD
jgi:hypothetical protein